MKEPCQQEPAQRQVLVQADQRWEQNHCLAADQRQKRAQRQLGRQMLRQTAAALPQTLQAAQHKTGSGQTAVVASCSMCTQRQMPQGVTGLDKDHLQNQFCC